jgi:putative pyruvate formate lyase activating enzyme
VGFVSPTHFIPQVKVIIRIIRDLGYDPVFIYNTNGYDKVSEIRKLENYIDVWLPDFKYMDAELAGSWSGAYDYPVNAVNAIKEMYRQAGSELIINDKGYAQKGLLIRHLVLPGAVSNSLDVLRTIASRISPEISISLMSQYYPNYYVAADKNLGRTLRKDEYEEVVKEMENLNMHSGWIQDMESYDNYRPDFSNKTHPFE